MYPYAPILFDYIRRAMPMANPQSMRNDDRPDTQAVRCMQDCK